jgi:serine/threonine protein kinase
VLGDHRLGDAGLIGEGVHRLLAIARQTLENRSAGGIGEGPEQKIAGGLHVRTITRRLWVSQALWCRLRCAAITLLGCDLAHIAHICGANAPILCGTVFIPALSYDVRFGWYLDLKTTPMTPQQGNPVDDSQEPVDLFRSIKSKIAQRENPVADDAVGINVDLSPEATGSVDDPGAIAQVSAPIPGLGLGHVLHGRYVIESQLGSGRMGTVYKALDRSRSEHTETDAYVAIKVLHQSLGTDALSKLCREFYCAQALAHQSVVKVYELDFDQEFPFFTMELIDGENLRCVMQGFHPLPLPRAYVWPVIREVGAGMVHAHERRVIHGDLKPQSVMVTNNGELRILDFGTLGETATALTPAYASCELLEGREPDPRDDLFALACLSYELLAGEHPYQQRRSTEARTLKMTPRRPPGLSGRQWKALTAALAWDRENRPASVREWLAELDLGREPLGPVPKRQDSKVMPLGKSHMTSAVIAVTAVVLVCGITWAVLSRPAPPSVVAVAADADTEATVPLNVQNAIADIEREESQAPAAAVVPAQPQVKHRTSGALTSTRPIDKTERIAVESASYSIRRGEKFAEIRVNRSSGSKGDTSFEWWTEPGSAVAGTDFAPQAPTMIVFPSRMRAVSLFIKLVPNASRKRTDTFYVVLGNASAGSALGAVSKAAVTLHR